MTVARLLLAVLFAVPAYLLTNETFTPVDEHVTLTGGATVHDFVLGHADPLYVEYGLTLRSRDPMTRPTAVISLNDVVVTRVPGDRLFVSMGGKVLARPSAVRTGSNRLRVTLEGTPDATVELRGRVQNYFGIAPDFPRVFVVADESVAAFKAAQSLARRGLRGVSSVAVGLLLVWAIAARTAASGHGRWVLASSPSWLPWGALAYSAATPLHIWLSVEALAVAALLGWCVACAVRWMASRRSLVVRVAAIAAVNVVVLELALRLFNAVSPSFIFYSTGYERYRGQPGAPFFDRRLNAGGFNDIDRDRVRPVGVTRRIVSIGDSFVLGVVPHEQNFLTRLERDLSADGRTEVINMGIPATEPADYLAMLVKEGVAYSPDLVIVNVFVGNDFETPGQRWYEHSFVATFVRALWHLRSGTTPAPATSDGRPAEYRDEAPSLSRERFLEIEVDRSWIYERAGQTLPAAVTRVAGELARMRDVARRAGADMLVVLIPDEAQIDDGLRADVVRASGYGERDLDFDQPNRMLGDRLTTDGIRVLDLLPSFRQAGRLTRLYKPQDTHWNIAGNRLAAQQIAAAVRANVRRAPAR